MAPRVAMPTAFSAATPPPPLLVATVATAPSVWLVQLPAGFDARRLVGSKLRCNQHGAGRVTPDGARLRIDVEEDRLAAQLVVVSAPCGGPQGALALSICKRHVLCLRTLVQLVRSASRRVTLSVLRDAEIVSGEAAETVTRGCGDVAAAGGDSSFSALGGHAAAAVGMPFSDAPFEPSSKAKKRRKGPV